MRILAFSDVKRWTPSYRSLVERWKPTIIALAGDLTSDGGAAFWHTALEAIPAFQRDMTSLRRRLGVRVDPKEGFDIIPRRSLEAWHDARWKLEDRYHETPAFLEARKRLHVAKFYSFLRYAGKRATVLVVKGDHDDDFEGDYDATKISAVHGCREISGRTCEVRGVTFLGLGYDHSGYRRPLRQLVLEHKSQVDVVIAHTPQENVRIIAELQPKLIIRGHFGWGRYLMDGVPTVFTAGDEAVIDTRRSKPPRVRILEDERWAMSDDRMQRHYPWLTPYPAA